MSLSSSPIGFPPPADGTCAGDLVQPSSVARASFFPICLSPLRQHLLQLPQDVSADISVRDASCCLAPVLTAHRPVLMAAVIAGRVVPVIFNRNQNAHGTSA